MSARTIQCNQRCRRSPRSTTAELFWDTSSRYLQSLRCGDAFFDDAQYMKRKLWPRRTREPAGRLATSGCLCAVASYFQKTSCLQNWSGSSGFLTFMSIRKGACRELAKYDGQIYFRQTRTTLFNFSVPSEIQIWITQEIPSGQPAPQFVTLQFVLKKGAFSEIFGNNFDDKNVACVSIDP